MLIETPVSTTRFLVYLQVYMKKLSRYSTYADMKISEFQRISEFRPLPKVDYTSIETPVVEEPDRLDVVDDLGSLGEERSALEDLMKQFTSASDFAETVAFNEEPEFAPVSDLGISPTDWFVSDSSSEVILEDEVIDSDFYAFLDEVEEDSLHGEGTSSVDEDGVEDDDSGWEDDDDDEPDAEDLSGWGDEPEDEPVDDSGWEDDDDEEPNDDEDVDGEEDLSGWEDDDVDEEEIIEDDPESYFEDYDDDEELDGEEDDSGWEDDDEPDEQVSISTPTVEQPLVSEPTVTELYTVIFNSAYVPRRPAFKYAPRLRASKPKAPISRPSVGLSKPAPKIPELHIQPPTPPVQVAPSDDKFVRLESEDVVAYARRLVRVSEEVAVKYFSPKEIEQALKAGKIMRRRGVLIFAHN